MNKISDENSKVVEKSEEEDEFVPRFVRVFNECKVYTAGNDGKIKDTGYSHPDNTHCQDAPKPIEKETNMPAFLLKPSKSQSKSGKIGGKSAIDKSSICKMPSLQLEPNRNDRRKKIVRTNTDSKIVIPKIDETEEEPFFVAPAEEASCSDKGSMENLKERIKEGRSFRFMQTIDMLFHIHGMKEISI